MICRKCARAIPDDAIFCCYCGVKQQLAEKKPRSHGNGQGSVFRRGNSWVAQVTRSIEAVPGDPGSPPRIRRHYLTKGGFKTSREARAYLPELLAQARGQYAQERRVPTIAELYSSYESSAMERLSKSTHTAYRIAWNKRIAPAIGDMPVDHLTVAAIDDIVRPLSYDTGKDVKDLLSIICKRAIADNFMLSNPTQYVTLAKQIGSSVEPWSDSEVDSLWRAFFSGDRTAASCLLMIYTGMMPGELFALETHMIDYDAHTIIGCGLKTKKRKEAPIIFPDFIAPVLQYLSSSTASRIGRVLGVNKDRFYDDFAQLKNRLGIRDVVRPYSGRHSTHTKLAQAGVAPALIVEIMRHKDYRTALAHYNEQPSAALVSALNLLKAPS